MSSPKAEPAPVQPGFWPSDLSEAAVMSASRDYAQVQIAANGDIYWVEFRPEEGGRCCLCRTKASAQGVIESLTPDNFSVQSRVHEYGGLSWGHLGDALVFVNAADQQLYLQDLQAGSQPRQLTHQSQSRFIEPLWDNYRQQIIAVEERHCESGVLNRLVAISRCGEIEVLAEGADFYASPALSPDGRSLAYISWYHPHQPWNATHLNLLRFEDCGRVLCDIVLAGDDREEALSQPRFDTNGLLHVMTDREGWWNLYRWQSGTLVPVLTDCADMISAPWQSGLSHYGFSDAGVVSITHQHETGLLCLDGRPLDAEYTCFRSLAVHDDFAVAVVAAPDRLPGIARIDLMQGGFQLICGGEQPLANQDCSKPQALSFGAGDQRCYGYLYAPANKVIQPQPHELFPLVIFLHGGPTAASYPILNMKLQYWTQRGFAVLDLNYRGSSNYGRAYRQQLHQRWGQLETEDISQALSVLIADHRIDPKAVFIRGNSSGGYTALNALCALDCFAAGASLYGVTDPLLLNQGTHKFESRYLHWLIGHPEQDAARYERFAPLNKVAQISAPVIFFQGEQDRVVLADQTRAMVSALQQRGVPVEAHYFADEAHGFRRAENMIEVLQKELAFYQCQIRPSAVGRRC
ncbi:S9 family peptidase [Neptuniibacter halophilus]|uniref:S9 family peptidase n=1 Tax=Neptuniibacter halophilus TaxID=651666 RepID=UPI0025724BF0|nr:S9 family peptidase [Neptuniibacter halophilus]